MFMGIKAKQLGILTGWLHRIFEVGGYGLSMVGDPKDYINITILHPGSGPHDKGLEDPYIYGFFWALNFVIHKLDWGLGIWRCREWISLGIRSREACRHARGLWQGFMRMSTACIWGQLPSKYPQELIKKLLALYTVLKRDLVFRDSEPRVS